jgi:eukaryotic-like serine/threonine-protein kinase
VEDEEDSRPTEAMAVPPVHEPDPLGTPFEITIGTAIGDYVVDGNLGHGGMGVVYSATHPVIGKRAAIKVLKSALSANPATVERFMQEARSVNQIGHPNIVDIFDFAKLPDGRCYLVMDLLVGESLRARVKKGAVHVREACVVLDEIASALAAAHAKGFIHRDLKPDNVFLSDRAGRLDVKLLDFGLAKLLPTSILANERAFRTATGVQLGTPDYMSPEQLRADKDVDARTDIYALGVLAFEILTGHRPRRLGGGTFDVDGTIAEAAGRVAGVTPELAQLVETMMAAEPENRPSLVAVRAVIKRLRPSLPTMAAASLSAMPASSLEMSASLVGARPLFPTPPTAVPTVRQPAEVPRENGLEPSAKPLPKTRLGVTPAPVITRRHPVAPPTKRTGHMWWLVAIGIVLAVGIVLAIVLA